MEETATRSMSLPRRAAGIVIADDRASRRAWQTPRVILGTMDEAELGGAIGGDTSTLS